jgi:limonene 1,2-monooxygenase
MHIAETREQAKADAAFGLEDWIDYFAKVAALPIVPGDLDKSRLVDAVIEAGVGVIGTPDDAIAQIERLEKQSGGFGTYLFMATDWADRDAMFHSYELFARHVMPHFTESTAATRASRDWVASRRPEQLGRAGEAIMKSITDHASEKETKQS